jgi:glutaredoxin 2
MVANYKHVAHEKVFLSNDDEETCFGLVGSKVVPILQLDDGTAIKESLDIVRELDERGDTGKVITQESAWSDYDGVLGPVKESIRILTYPRCLLLGLPEFETQSAKDYFQNKKEKTIGMTFSDAMHHTDEHVSIVNSALASLPAPPLKPVLSMDDVMLFPVLRNLSMVKVLAMPKELKRYMAHVASLTHTESYASKAI